VTITHIPWQQDTSSARNDGSVTKILNDSRGREEVTYFPNLPQYHVVSN